MPTPAQLQAFHQAAVHHVHTIENEVYRPQQFIKWMSDFGAYEAALQVIHAPRLPEGFATLYHAGRLDLTIEAFVLQPQWTDMFDPQTLQAARARLAEMGYAA